MLRWGLAVKNARQGKWSLLQAGKELLRCAYTNTGNPKAWTQQERCRWLQQKEKFLLLPAPGSLEELATVRGDLMALVLLPTCWKTKHSLSLYWDLGIWDPQIRG